MGRAWDVEPMVGLAVQSRAAGAEMGLCAPPDEEFAAAEACDAPVATGVMSTGLWG